jgi:hypothetical protein
MFRLNSTSGDRKPSGSSSKSGIKAITSRLKPELRLAVDTDVSRHQGAVPEQVFPYETRSQRRSVSQTASILSQRRKARPAGLKRHLENRDNPEAGLARSDSLGGHAQSCTGLPSRPDVNKHPCAGDDNTELGNNLAAPALHSRVRGLRPSPLNLVDISPSDRAIPIGLAVSSAAISDHTTSPLTATPRIYSPPNYGHEAVTPTIIVTPAREDFDPTPPSYLSLHDPNNRIASSIYSRYTNCAPRTAQYAATPPVPPLPLFARQPLKQTVSESKLPTYEESRSATSHKATLSVCTVFEEDEHLQPPTSARSFSGLKIRSLKRQSTLPTPRRSRGWWNVITSPFSARSNGLFWRSPTDESADRTPILGDASAMGAAEISWGDPFETSKEIHDLSPQSAPATRLCAVPGSESRSMPKRSITAPGALDPNADVMNIYRVPSQGAAAAYYDQTRHFPSLLIDPAHAIPRSVFEDDSPLTDVCACERHRHGSASDRIATSDVDGSKRASTCSKNSQSTAHGVAVIDADLKSPFDDAHVIDDQRSSPLAPPRAIFTSPTVTELLSPSPIRGTPSREPSDAACVPRESIENLTPVIEDAHVATVVGPRSSNGEHRAVIIPPSRAPSPPGDIIEPQQAAIVARSIDTPETVNVPVQATRDDGYRPPMHPREASRGLGISSSQEDLFPPPKMLCEKPRLATDRFGQLVIVTEKDERPVQPWYRRFFWLLVTACVSLLLLFVVLLIVFIPQTHAVNAVQAQWLNLTGFPPLPTGVSTVIQPKKTLDKSQCVDPPTLWSCAMPQTQLAREDKSTLPDFRFEIRFRNHTLENTTALVQAANYSSTSGPASVRSQLRARSSWSQLLYSPNPTPPSKTDQLALGSNTDNITAPYAGEETPFYLSLLNPQPIPQVQKRSESASNSSSTHEIPNPYPYPHPSNTITNSKSKPKPISTKIPKPLLTPNGKPSPQLLYPYATAQPLRLYNRGQPDEHYGFYTYFAKTALVANVSSASASIPKRQVSNSTLTTTPPQSASVAQALCSFTQTRFRVQIWTQRPGSSSLASMLNFTTSAFTPAAQSSANEMRFPGSFPYGVSISLDRESGPQGDEGKGVFCWALDEGGRVVGEGIRVDGVKGGSGEVERRDDEVEVERRGEEGPKGPEGPEGGKCGCGWES